VDLEERRSQNVNRGIVSYRSDPVTLEKVRTGSVGAVTMRVRTAFVGAVTMRVRTAFVCIVTIEGSHNEYRSGFRGPGDSVPIGQPRSPVALHRWPSWAWGFGSNRATTLPRSASQVRIRPYWPRLGSSPLSI